MRRFAASAAAATAAVSLAPNGPPPSRGTDTAGGHRREVGRGQPQRIEGIGIHGWHDRAVRNRRTINRLRRQLRDRLHRSRSLPPVEAIRIVFGPYAGQAVQVARCESGLSPWASNGQFAGLFQMGSHERQLYGHGSTALEQARAAYVYFWTSGRDWSPWTCKP